MSFKNKAIERVVREMIKQDTDDLETAARIVFAKDSGLYFYTSSFYPPRDDENYFSQIVDDCIDKYIEMLWTGKLNNHTECV